MSKSNWGNETRIVVVATCVFLAAISLYAVWGMSALHTKETISASSRASQYAKDAEQQILEACMMAELSAMRECVTEKIQASEENQRAAYDLVAQNDVARWTFWVLVLGVVGTGMTGVGLYYLAANLDEMRESKVLTNKALDAANEANSISRQNAYNQIRPWIDFEAKITRVEQRFREHDGNSYPDWAVYVDVTIKNIGGSPTQINIYRCESFLNAEEAKKRLISYIENRGHLGGLVNQYVMLPNAELTSGERVWMTDGPYPIPSCVGGKAQLLAVAFYQGGDETEHVIGKRFSFGQKWELGISDISQYFLDRGNPDEMAVDSGTIDRAT